MRWPDGWSAAGLVAQSPFNCLLTEGTQSGAPMVEGLRVVTQAPEGVRMVDGVAPRIKMTRDEKGRAEAGPTGKPWVEANGWLVSLERARHPESAVWVGFNAERDWRPDMYVRSIAEPAVYGGRWVVSLGEDLARKVADKDAEALDIWKRMSGAARFFDDHAEWRGWRTQAAVGVLSTFAKDNEYLSQEFLNLAARRPLPVRIFPVERAASLDWSGLAAMVVADAGALPSAVEERLKSFKGLVLRQSKEQWDDPFVMVEQAHLKIGREHDVLRLYNGTSANVHYTASADGKRGLVQVIAFGREQRELTVAVNKKWRVGRVFTLEQPKGVEGKIAGSRFGTELIFPEFKVFAAMELEA
jgi:hypothetical protein